MSARRGVGQIAAVLVVLGMAVPLAHAEWFTLFGHADDADSDYVQVDPGAIEVDGDMRTVPLRINVAKARTNREGRSFRSVESRVLIDCKRREAWYVQGAFFEQPRFVEPPAFRRVYPDDGTRFPMTFAGIATDFAPRVVRAACSVTQNQRRLSPSIVVQNEPGRIPQQSIKP